MNLLLDTHIWLWLLLEPERLRPQIINIVKDRASELWLSPISVWEVLLLSQRGSFRPLGNRTPVEWIDEALSILPLHDAPLTRQVAVHSHKIRTEHRDPADRFLAATASVYDLTLVTNDERLLRGEGYRTLGNR
ncbi:MAG: type II toxin-antitoxin system VapC family toxin [Chloroflexota bacterium]